MDSIGVNTHFNYRNTAYYRRFEECKQVILDANVRHIRGQAVNENSSADVIKLQKSLAQSRIKLCLLIFNHNTPATGIDPCLASIRNHLANSMDYIEGHNEPDMSWPDKQNWATGSTAWLKEIRAKVKADPVLQHIRIAGSALAHPEVKESQRLMGDLSSLVDVANVHAYPGGRPNEARISAYLNATRAIYGNHPFIVTETGYHTALENPPQKHKPTSEAAKAIYLPSLLMDNLRLGIERSYIYLIVDKKAANQKDQEAHFGLVSHDLQPKPSYLALKNLSQILRDPGHTVFKTGAIDFTIPNVPPELRSVLLQKTDGRFYLALWRYVKIWDEARLQEIPLSSTTVQVRFASPMASVRQYLPNQSGTPVNTSHRVSAVDLSMDARLNLLEIQP